jgi:hypothetical protein
LKTLLLEVVSALLVRADDECRGVMFVAKRVTNPLNRGCNFGDVELALERCESQLFLFE